MEQINANQEDENQVTRDRFLTYRPGDRAPTMLEYMEELYFQVYIPIYLVYETMSLLDDVGAYSEDMQQHVENLLWVSLHRWRELDAQFKELSKRKGAEGAGRTAEI